MGSYAEIFGQALGQIGGQGWATTMGDSPFYGKFPPQQVIFRPPPPSSYKAKLQQEIDGWLEDLFK